MRLSLPPICVLLALLQIVSSFSRYLFENGEILYRNEGNKTLIPKKYRRLASIDHHVFAHAFVIKVNASNMKMYEGAVQNLPHLRKLRLKECGIKSLLPKCFRNLPNIEMLHLQENDLTEIRKGVFNDLPVKELWLHKNEIETIEPEAFDNMPNLEEIRLNKNFLTVWDGRWFAYTPKLERIYMKRNSIKELLAKAFANIKTSHKKNNEEVVDTSIYLSSNKISFIHPEALHGIDSLAELNLRKNKLTKLDTRIFSHMTELHTLTLSRNRLSELDRNAFRNMDVMDILDLSSNSFDCVPFEVVKVAKTVNLTTNRNVNCNCLLNLKAKLDEEKLPTKIVLGKRQCGLN